LWWVVDGGCDLQRMIGTSIKQMEVYIAKALYMIALKAADMKKFESRFRDCMLRRTSIDIAVAYANVLTVRA
jgi:hypothetical protein